MMYPGIIDIVVKNRTEYNINIQSWLKLRSSKTCLMITSYPIINTKKYDVTWWAAGKYLTEAAMIGATQAREEVAMRSDLLPRFSHVYAHKTIEKAALIDAAVVNDPMVDLAMPIRSRA